MIINYGEVWNAWAPKIVPPEPLAPSVPTTVAAPPVTATILADDIVRRLAASVDSCPPCAACPPCAVCPPAEKHTSPIVAGVVGAAIGYFLVKGKTL